MRYAKISVAHRYLIIFPYLSVDGIIVSELVLYRSEKFDHITTLQVRLVITMRCIIKIE